MARKYSLLVLTALLGTFFCDSECDDQIRGGFSHAIRGRLLLHTRVKRREWSPAMKCRIMSQNGRENNNYLQVLDGRLVANGDGTNLSSVFSIYSALDFDYRKGVVELLMVECAADGGVIAVNHQRNGITMKRLPTAINQHQTISSVKRSNPEVLFYRVPYKTGSDLFYLVSCLRGSTLGFHSNGRLMNTTQITPGSKESLLRAVVGRTT